MVSSNYYFPENRDLTLNCSLPILNDNMEHFYQNNRLAQICLPTNGFQQNDTNKFLKKLHKLEDDNTEFLKMKFYFKKKADGDIVI